MADAIEYSYLSVTIEVLLNKVHDFEATMARLLPFFEEPIKNPQNPHNQFGAGLGWKLLSAVKDDGGVEKATYHHLWQIPRDATLRDAMIRLGRKPEYQMLELCKISETQDIFSVAAVFSSFDGDDRPGGVSGRAALASEEGQDLVIETVDAPADWFQLHDWQEAMPVMAAELDESRGMQFLFAIHAETGRLRRFLSFWRVPRDRSLADVREAVGAMRYPANPQTVAALGLRPARAGEPPWLAYPPSTFQRFTGVVYRRQLEVSSAA